MLKRENHIEIDRRKFYKTVLALVVPMALQNLINVGAGFIGSHTCVELLNAGYDVVIVDNLYNASEKAVDRVKEITGKDLKFYQVDIRDREGLNEVFDKEVKKNTPTWQNTRGERD